MLFRLRCYLVSLLALAATIVFVYETAVPSMVWLQERFPDQLALQLAGMFLWLIAANLIFLGPVGLLRCPACRRHFGLRNYLVDGWLHLVPPRDCPACGVDMYAKAGDTPPSQDRTGLRAA
jgi:hypothetical protein